jgi:hypothetical protein
VAGRAEPPVWAGDPVSAPGPPVVGREPVAPPVRPPAPPLPVETLLFVPRSLEDVRLEVNRFGTFAGPVRRAGEGRRVEISAASGFDRPWPRSPSPPAARDEPPMPTRGAPSAAQPYPYTGPQYPYAAFFWVGYPPYMDGNGPPCQASFPRPPTPEERDPRRPIMAQQPLAYSPAGPATHQPAVALGRQHQPPPPAQRSPG